MAQEQDITFITEDIPGATSFIQSGKSLRLYYAARQEAKYINEAVMANIAVPGSAVDPTTIDTKTWKSLRAGWKKDAEIKYPDEGDYKVWIVDPNTGAPAPLGEVVEFIGGDVRENPGILPCVEYQLDLSGAGIADPSTTTVEISYTDCRIQQVEMSDTADNIDGIAICVGQGRTPHTSAGVFTQIGPCDVNFGLPVCEEYTWDLTGLPLDDLFTLGFKNCAGIDEKIEDTPRKLGVIVNFCAQSGTATSTVGVITYVGVCST